MDRKALGRQWPLVLLVLLSAGSVAAAGNDRGLFDAIKSGNRAAIQAALTRTADINTPEPDGTTPLHWAVRGNDLEIVRLLLKAGANAKTANRYGVTPIALAAANGNAEIIEALVKAGADANTALPEGETALMTAARTGNPAALKVLIAHGAKVNVQEKWLGETPLMWAAAENHPEAVRVLIESGADPDIQSDPTKFGRKVGGQTTLPRGGFTALMFAARQGHLEAARVLAEAGANLDQGDPEGTTALMLAIINSRYDLAAMLLEYGADPNPVDETGMGALYAAVDMHTLQYMHGRPDPKVKIPEPFTSADLARMLLDYGASPNAPLTSPILRRHNSTGNQNLGAGSTPLMRAAKSGDVALMRLLVERGADPNMKQKNGNTVLLLAAGFGRRFDQNSDAQEYERGTEAELFEAVKVCVELGQDVNAANDLGDTPLHVAAGESIVRYLADHGAKLNATNKQGRTPLDVALARKDRSGRQLLPGAVIGLQALGAVSVKPATNIPDEPAGNAQQQ
jgi:ankyrin repeat protein